MYCPFCKSIRPKTKHYLQCKHFDPIWKYLRELVNKSGENLSEKCRMKGFSKNVNCLNNLLFIAYRTIYDTFIFEFNSFPYDSNCLLRYKQNLFETLYVAFHIEKRKGIDHEFKFNKYWSTINFCFKIHNSTIKINL